MGYGHIPRRRTSIYLYYTSALLLAGVNSTRRRGVYGHATYPRVNIPYNLYPFWNFKDGELTQCTGRMPIVY
jgi:hypothetical protein